jgi:hypothetical protein
VQDHEQSDSVNQEIGDLKQTYRVQVI